jgi:hypothetical protein
MARTTFIDPAGVLDDYPWPFNHTDESDFGKSRNIEHGGNTGDVGFVRQQSDDSPLILRFSGVILLQSQVEAMLEWFELCKTQTIYFRDFTGIDEYEVIVTRFVPTRHYTVKNPRDSANAPTWYWRYEIDMDVIDVRAGVWEGVTP